MRLFGHRRCLRQFGHGTWLSNEKFKDWSRVAKYFAVSSVFSRDEIVGYRRMSAPATERLRDAKLNGNLSPY
jgi:hypothetical protein